MPVRCVSTAYGPEALDAVRDVVAEAKAGDPMAPVTLLLPTNLAGVVARRRLAHGLGDSRRGIAGITLATLSRHAEQLAAPSLAPRRPATGPVVSAAWRAALTRAPGIFASVADHPTTVRALVSAHRELRDLSTAGLDAVATASGLCAELVRLHRLVVAEVADRWYDATDLMHTATTLVLDGPTGPAAEVVLYLPQRLTRAEAAFARALGTLGRLTIVVGLTGVVRADREVRRSLERIGVEPEPRPRVAPVADEVLHASDSDDEVRLVVRRVVEALAETPAHRIAVLYGSQRPYARLLHEHLAASGIAVNGPGTQPVVERAIARGFLDVLGLAERDVPRADLFTALTEAPVRRPDGGRPPTSRWERISRLAAVVSGDDWDRRLLAYEASQRRQLADADPDALSAGRVTAVEAEARATAELRDFATGLRQRLAAGRALSGWPALAEWALDLFRDLYGDEHQLARLPADEQYAAAVVQGTLRAVAELGDLEAGADYPLLVDVLTLELESARPRVGRFGDGVLVAPLTESIGLDADLILVLGLAEDLYPGRLAEDALLPDQARRASLGELGSFRDALDALQRQLLAALDAAPHVVASFPRGDLRRSTQRLPSQWLLPTLRAIADDRDLAATDWERLTVDAAAGGETGAGRVFGSASFAASIRGSAMPASEQEWRTQAAATGRRFADNVVDEAQALLDGRAGATFTRFDGDLRAVEGLPNYADGVRLVSPTALESFAGCPHAYFVERMLGVSPVEQPEEIVAISPIDVGNLIHQTMDRFITACDGSLPGFGEPWSDDQRAVLRRIADETAVEFEQRGATGHRALWRSERERILGDLDFMLDDDDRRRRERRARVRGSELTFGSGTAEPVRIEVDAGTVLMRGSADKVDETESGTLIVVDIKTGGTTRYRPIKTDPIVAGTKLQLPVYARAAKQLLGGTDAEAAYWFVRQGKRDWIPVVLTDELDRTFTSALGTLTSAIATGLFPAKAPDSPDFKWVQCAYCNPDGLGHGEVRARYERKRVDQALAPLVRLIDPDGAAGADEGGAE